jgi:hypothetical protein
MPVGQTDLHPPNDLAAANTIGVQFIRMVCLDLIFAREVPPQFLFAAGHERAQLSLSGRWANAGRTEICDM